MTASCVAIDTAPLMGGAQRQEKERLILRQPVQQRCRIVQPAGLINQLLDIHRDQQALGHAARESAGFSSLCNPRGLTQPRMDFGQAAFDG